MVDYYWHTTLEGLKWCLKIGRKKGGGGVVQIKKTKSDPSPGSLQDEQNINSKLKSIHSRINLVCMTEPDRSVLSILNVHVVLVWSI